MKTHFRMLVSSLPLLALPIAFAGSAKFEAMDTNGDGKVSRVEHRNASEKMFKQIDKNRDGVVSATELRSAVDDGDSAGGSAREKFKKMDGNSDGRITEREHATAAYTMFSEADTNKDRFLSREELDAAHEKAAAEHDS